MELFEFFVALFFELFADLKRVVHFEKLKNVDINNINMYVIEEAHNFINNVYGNVTSGKGKRIC